MQLLLSISCSFLVAAGLLFILIALYTNYDKVFRYIGFGLVVLAIMAAVDIWIIPKAISMESKLYWQKVLHIIVGVAALIVSEQVKLLTKKTYRHMSKIIGIMFIAVTILVLNSNMLYIKDQAIVGNILYSTIFVPYILICGWFFTYPIYNRLKLRIQKEKRILNFQMYGMLILVIFGCLDMFQFLKPEGSQFPDYKVVGILVYGLANALIFAEHFLNLLRERDENKKRIESAYAELQQSASLRQLGESSAIINHEIKNYMFMISGNAQLIQEMNIVTGKPKALLDNIVTSVARLAKFSNDILDLSKTHILKDKKPLIVNSLIQEVIHQNFEKRAEHIELIGFDKDCTITGDWDKLHQVFNNLLGNAFDAAHPDEPLNIKVKITESPNIVLLTVEDNGVGCDEEQMKKMFTAFFTTKRGQKGTGLGLSITRTIIESHGGHISLYSKNLAEGGQHGVKFQISFPNFADEVAKVLEHKAPVLVIKEGLPNIAGIIRVFQNVYVAPHFVQNVEDLVHQNFDTKYVTVVASAETVKAHYAKLKGQYLKVCLLTEQQGSLFAYEYGSNKTPKDFCEEYVLHELTRRNMIQAKSLEDPVTA